MALYKALEPGMMSFGGFGPWVKNEWQTQPEGALKLGTFGLHCSNDVLWALGSTGRPVYICKIETAGDSVISPQTRKGETIVSDAAGECWRQMRVTNVWTWPKEEVQGLALYAEGFTHPTWERARDGLYAAQAAAWQSAMNGGRGRRAATKFRTFPEAMTTSRTWSLSRPRTARTRAPSAATRCSTSEATGQEVHP